LTRTGNQPRFIHPQLFLHRRLSRWRFCEF
jgi:hypothetical protein